MNIYSIILFIWSFQAKLIFNDRHQRDYHILNLLKSCSLPILPESIDRKNHKGAFWNIGNILYLDMTGESKDMFINKNSAKYTPKIHAFYCICYTSIEKFIWGTSSFILFKLLYFTLRLHITITFWIPVILGCSVYSWCHAESKFSTFQLHYSSSVTSYSLFSIHSV